METDPVAPFVVLPSGHVVQFASSAPANVFSEQFVHTPPIITTPAPVHTVNQKYNILIYSFTQVNYIFYFISIHFYSLLIASSPNLISVLYPLRFFTLIYLPQSSMETDPVAPFVVLPSGHVVQFASSAPANVFSEQFVHTPPIITTPAPVHTVNQKYNILIYSFTQVNYIFYFISIHFYSLLIASSPNLISVLYPLRFFTLIYLPQSSMETDPVAPFVVLPSGHVVQFASSAPANVFSEQFVHTPPIITTPAPVHTVNQKYNILIYSFTQVNYIFYFISIHFYSLLIASSPNLISVLYPLRFFTLIYLPQSSMETDPVAPFVVLPSGHVVQFASSAPANVFSEQFVHTPPIITTPAPVHTVNQKYNILIYSFTQVNYIFYFISIHFYSLLIASSPNLISVLYPLRFFTLIYLPQSSMETDPVAPFVVLPSGHVVQFASSAPANVFSEQFVHTPPIITTPAPVHTVNQKYNILIYSFTQVNYIFYFISIHFYSLLIASSPNLISVLYPLRFFTLIYLPQSSMETDPVAPFVVLPSGHVVQFASSAPANVFSEQFVHTPPIITTPAPVHTVNQKYNILIYSFTQVNYIFYFISIHFYSLLIASSPNLISVLYPLRFFTLIYLPQSSMETDPVAPFVVLPSGHVVQFASSAPANVFSEQFVHTPPIITTPAPVHTVNQKYNILIYSFTQVNYIFYFISIHFYSLLIASSPNLISVLYPLRFFTLIYLPQSSMETDPVAPFVVLPSGHVVQFASSAPANVFSEQFVHTPPIITTPAPVHTVNQKYNILIYSFTQVNYIFYFISIHFYSLLIASSPNLISVLYPLRFFTLIYLPQSSMETDPVAPFVVLPSGHVVQFASSAPANVFSEQFVHTPPIITTPAPVHTVNQKYNILIYSFTQVNYIFYFISIHFYSLLIASSPNLISVLYPLRFFTLIYLPQSSMETDPVAPFVVLPSGHVVQFASSAPANVFSEQFVHTPPIITTPAPVHTVNQKYNILIYSFTQVNYIFYFISIHFYSLLIASSPNLISVLYPLRFFTLIYLPQSSMETDPVAPFVVLPSGHVVQFASSAPANVFSEQFVHTPPIITTPAPVHTVNQKYNILIYSFTQVNYIFYFISIHFYSLLIASSPNLISVLYPLRFFTLIYLPQSSMETDPVAPFVVLPSGHVVQFASSAPANVFSEQFVHTPPIITTPAPVHTVNQKYNILIYSFTQVNYIFYFISIHFYSLLIASSPNLISLLYPLRFFTLIYLPQSSMETDPVAPFVVLPSGHVVQFASSAPANVFSEQFVHTPPIITTPAPVHTVNQKYNILIYSFTQVNYIFYFISIHFYSLLIASSPNLISVLYPLRFFTLIYLPQSSMETDPVAPFVVLPSGHVVQFASSAPANVFSEQFVHTPPIITTPAPVHTVNQKYNILIYSFTQVNYIFYFISIHFYSLLIASSPNLISVLYPLRFFTLIYLPQSSMETDPVAPFVVLPSGHVVQFASSAPANVFSEQFVHTPPIITTPAPVHTVNQKYNILIYSFTQVNYIFYFISIHFYSLLIASSPNLISVLYPLRFFTLIYLPQSSMETDPVAPFVVLPSGHVVQFASSAPANVFSEQFVHTPPIITTPAPVHTVNQKYNILIYSFTQVNYIFYFISIHFYSLLIASSPNLISVLYPLRFFTLIYLPQSSMETDPVAPFVVLPSGHVVQFASSAPANVFSEQFVHTPPIITTPAPVHTVNQKYNILIYSFTQVLLLPI